jgi:multimeric flavodoxin WrbA/putative sterol carrier protein
MPEPYTVAAVNASPHVGFGNTSRMVDLLRENLAVQGLELTEICLARHRLEPCTGCALCLEKGACWIKDDYQALVQQVLAADAVILASPVYFLNVTGRMKTFLDRSLGYGHRPRGAWKPGLAVSVSAGQGETWVADYLSRMLGVFGAFAVGRFTALAVGPGEFLGGEAVAQRAADLAGDLARAVKEKRRYPATDQDLHYWLFMSRLVREHQDFLQADHAHWQKLGLYDSFEAYVGQIRAQSTRSPEMRQAWLEELMDRHREKAAPPPPELPLEFTSVRELLRTMPQALNREAAQGLKAVLEFRVTGRESFTGHLTIENQEAAFSEGPAPRPDLVIQTPADVWLAIATGALDGAQAFMSGKFTAEGDVSLLMRLTSLFPG